MIERRPSTEEHDQAMTSWTEFADSHQEHQDALDAFLQLVALRRAGALVPVAEMEQTVDRLDASFRRMKAAASIVVGQDCSVDYGVPAPKWRERARKAA